MKNTPRRLTLLILVAVIFLVACGGGGGSSSQPTQPQPVTITTASPLPGTLQGHAYSTTLTASGGQGAYHWSIAPISSTALFPSSLSIDPSTGVLSGPANWGGTAGFIATVADSASPANTASKTFTITASTPLTVAPTLSINIIAYGSVTPAGVAGLSGGVVPLKFSLDASCLPPGIASNVSILNSHLQPTAALLSGAPYVTGSFHCTLTVQDSFSPLEYATQALTITVNPPPLEDTNSLPVALLLNRPFSGRAIARGGVPPYSFAINSGSLPPGISLEPSTGEVSGTPATPGFYSYGLTITDSSSPVQTISSSGKPMSVQQAKGRNDSPATATAIGNGTITGSISPYIDPPNGTPVPGDNDYYKLVSLGGATVHVETVARRTLPGNALDTVIEIVDGNGAQLSTCRQPGDTSTNFNSACLNDDISSTVQDSALDFQVPGAANTANTFYVHVLDWRGDARPEMQYQLNVSGTVAPLAINLSHLLAADRGIAYSGYLTSTNATGAVTWSLDSGSLPPGITMHSGGDFSGAATTNGMYVFTVRATDSGNPPQSVTAATSIQVADPLTISSPAIWPDACQNQFYSFAVQTSGGAAPIHFVGFQSNKWIALNMGMTPDRLFYDGVFSGTPDVTGTFTGTVYALDAAGVSASQVVSVTVKTCP